MDTKSCRYVWRKWCTQDITMDLYGMCSAVATTRTLLITTSK